MKPDIQDYTAKLMEAEETTEIPLQAVIRVQTNMTHYDL